MLRVDNLIVVCVRQKAEKFRILPVASHNSWELLVLNDDVKELSLQRLLQNYLPSHPSTASLCPPGAYYAIQMNSYLCFLLQEEELHMQAQGLFAQNGWCSSVHTGLCYAATDAGRPFVSEDREVFRDIGNFFVHFQISYWRRSVSYYRGLLHCGVVPRQPGLGGRSNSVERDLPLKKKVLLCLRSIISCTCNKP